MSEYLIIPKINANDIILKYQQYFNIDHSKKNDDIEEINKNNVENEDLTKCLSHEICLNSSNHLLSYYDNDKPIQMILNSNHQFMPTEVNIRCWWCGQSPIKNPILLPMKYNPPTKKNIQSYEGEGYFDHPACMLAYYNKNKHKHRYKNIFGYIDMFITDFYGKDIEIKCAPSWKLLESYGGSLSRKNFNEERGKCIYKKLDGHNKYIPLNRQLFVDIKCPNCDCTIVSSNNLVTLLPIGTWYIKQD